MKSGTLWMACGLLAAVAMTSLHPANADNPATAGTSGGQPLNIRIDSPTAGQTVGAGQVVVSGRVALGALFASTAVQYIIPTEGFFRGDALTVRCRDEPLIDSRGVLRQGVYFGDTTYCLHVGIRKLNAQLSTMVDVQVGAPFRDVDPSTEGFQTFTSASDDRDGDGFVDIIRQVHGADSGYYKYPPSYGSKLKKANDDFALRPLDEQHLMLFLSDLSAARCDTGGFPGQVPCDPETIAEIDRARASGTRIDTYSVGGDCGPGNLLTVMAARTGGRCTPVADGRTLSAVLGQAITPAGLRKVDIRIDGGPNQAATLDAVGNFSALITAAPGSHAVTATVTAEDGSSATATIDAVLVNSVVQSFAFAAREAVPPGRLVESDEIVVRGAVVPVTAVIDAGEYRVNGGAYRSAPSQVQAGDRIQLRLQPSIINGVEVAATLRLGAMSGRFAVTTRFDDSLDALIFPAKFDVASDSFVCSDSMMLVGIDVPIPYLGNLFTAERPVPGSYTPSMLINGDKVSVCLMSPEAGGASRSTEVSAGGLTARFEVTTLVDATPDAFDFADQTVPLLTVDEPRTATITVKGINVPVPISISGGRYSSYSINGGPFHFRTEELVRNGDTVTLRNRLPLLDKSLRVASEEMTVSIGGISDRWALRLKLLP